MAASLAPAPTTAVMGVELGKPLTIAECMYHGKSKRPGGYLSEFDTKNTLRPCYQVKDRYLVEKPASQIAAGVVEVKLLLGNTPAGIDWNKITGTLIDGALHELRIGTTGVRDQEAVLYQLKAKFNVPTDAKVEQVQNRMGATFSAVDASWRFSDLSIQFYGLLGSIDKGLILLSTPKGTERAAAEAEAKEAARPTL